jgi:cytochrome c553
MLALQAGRRPSAVKYHIYASFSREILAEAAAYYASQAPADSPESVPPEEIARGEEAYLAGCAFCHGDNGRAVDHRGLGAPRLAGQPSVYLLGEMRNFVSGRRPFGSYMMARAHNGVSDARLESLALFFAAQPAQAAEAEPSPEAGGKHKKRARQAGSVR